MVPSISNQPNLRKRVLGARRFLLPNADGIFPQRGRRSPLTEGLGSPHEGFEFPTRRAGGLFISHRDAEAPWRECCQLPIGIGYWNWVLATLATFTAFPVRGGVLPCGGWRPPLRRLASSPVPGFEFPCTGGRESVYQRTRCPLSQCLPTDKMSVVPVPHNGQDVRCPSASQRTRCPLSLCLPTDKMSVVPVPHNGQDVRCPSAPPRWRLSQSRFP